MNQWHYNKIKQLKDWKSDLNAVLVFAKTDEETRKDTVRYISLLDYAIEQIERVQELEDKLARIRFVNNDYDKINKRYRDMLVKIFKIVQNHQIMKISDEDYADAATLLYKWIYDTGVIDHEKHFSEVHGHDEFDSYQINLLLKKHTSKKSSKALEGDLDE